jgi:predicted RNA-binding protein (virulence factor B family)
MSSNDQKVKIGKVSKLRVVTSLDFGLYLDGGEELGEILLPRRYVPEGCDVDDVVEVFLYLDSEDRLIATTETPFAMVGELACLRVVDTTPTGAFLDWGLSKDLLVPFREQRERMVRDKYYIVYIYFDTASERLVASSKVHKYINIKASKYSPGDEVELIVGNQFDLGYNVIIDKRFVGVLFRNEVFQTLEPGQRIKGYIKAQRPDGKIDVELQRSGNYDPRELWEQIISELEKNDGFLPFNDATPPEEIYERFKVSKRAYKKAIGGLYKRRLISIEDGGIRAAGKNN